MKWGWNSGYLITVGSRSNDMQNGQGEGITTGLSCHWLLKVNKYLDQLYIYTPVWVLSGFYELTKNALINLQNKLDY